MPFPSFLSCPAGRCKACAKRFSGESGCGFAFSPERSSRRPSSRARNLALSSRPCVVGGAWIPESCRGGESAGAGKRFAGVFREGLCRARWSVSCMAREDAGFSSVGAGAGRSGRSCQVSLRGGDALRCVAGGAAKYASNAPCIASEQSRQCTRRCRSRCRPAAPYIRRSVKERNAGRRFSQWSKRDCLPASILEMHFPRRKPGRVAALRRRPAMPHARLG